MDGGSESDITSQNRIEKSGRVLVIRNAMKDDSGVWRCTVANVVANVSSETTVFVRSNLKTFEHSVCFALELWLLGGFD